jgi:NMD protein affecting ribosome stability and mRNA decay
LTTKKAGSHDMKSEHGGFRPQRREQLLDDPRHDSYRATGKLSDPTRCPVCGATFHKGRWTWSAAPAGAPEQRCPACLRIQDGFPAGYVKLGGEFFAAHRDDILNLVRNCEAAEKLEHPMQRIIAIEDQSDGVVVTTTDAHLARHIAERVHDACKGTLAVQYSKQENLFRASWKR